MMCFTIRIHSASEPLRRCTQQDGSVGEDGWCTWPDVRSIFCSSQPPMVGHNLRSRGSVDASSCPSSPGAMVMLSHLHRRKPVSAGLEDVSPIRTQWERPGI